MNEKLIELFEYYRHLRSMQTIVEDILQLDYYTYNYDEQVVIDLIDRCITRYGKDIRIVGSLYKDKVVVENDETLYERKDSVEINSDCEFIRDALIIIGAVKSGIRNSIQQVVQEINEYDY